MPSVPIQWDIRVGYSYYIESSFEGFHKMGVPPNHPFINGFSWIFHEINHPAIGVMTMETSISPYSITIESLLDS